MKRVALFLAFLQIMPVWVSAKPQQTGKLSLYPAPNGALKAPDFHLFVNGREVFVYDNPVAAYAYFDFEGEVEIEIRPAVDVKGIFVMRNANNVVIRGRGILDGSNARGIKTDYLKWTRLINMVESNHITVKDIILHNSNTWQVVPMMSDHIRISNVRLVSGNPSDDGIDIVRSSHFVVENCFIRVKDDCVVIKAFLNDPDNRGVKDVTVENCVLWNAEWGNGIEIGFELLSDVRDVVFRILII